MSEELVTVTMTIPREKAAKVSAFMASDTWEREMAARNANLAKCRESLVKCVNFVREHHANSTRFIASVLCSLYNGQRVKVDLSDIGLLDMEWAQHVINVIRPCTTTVACGSRTLTSRTAAGSLKKSSTSTSSRNGAGCDERTSAGR